MAAFGEIDPMPEFAIFADTTSEPYAWLDYLETRLPYAVHRVCKGNLTSESLRVRTSKKTGITYLKHSIPAYMLRANGKKGMMQRACTLDFKITPIHQFLRKSRNGQPVTLWLGISTDEADRMKPSRVGWIEHRYPLIEMGMSRSDCLSWMADKGFPQPPSSACKYCPFRGDRKWLALTPEEFKEAVQYERDLQAAYAQCPRIDGVPFLHDSRVPLDKVVFTDSGSQSMSNECEGHCGL